MTDNVILTNPRMAGKKTMSDLEVRARKGCPFAQEQLTMQAYQSANLTKKLQKQGLSRLEAQRELKGK